MQHVSIYFNWFMYNGCLELVAIFIHAMIIKYKMPNYEALLSNIESTKAVKM